MKQHEEITASRIEQVVKRIAAARYESPQPVGLEYFRTEEPVPFSELGRYRFQPLALNEVWGHEFDCAWIRVSVTVPKSFNGREVALVIRAVGEGCLHDTKGVPIQGITYNVADPDRIKDLVPLRRRARGGERLTYLIDAAANDYFGAGVDGTFFGGRGASVRKAELVVLRRDVWDLHEDCTFLWNLRNALPHSNPRRGRILYALNDLCNLWEDAPSPSLVRRCRAALAPELSRPANAGAFRISAIGHAHMDVAWLWPLRETVRKMVRTFSTALKLMAEYPEYKLGVSQPQVFQMIKDTHPALYKRVKRAVRSGRIEPQGAMWVESDCHIPSGESLIRQVLYGKRFFRKEFGIDIDCCWLPDAFGFSGNLPQILARAGVRYFLSTKLSWCKLTEFPHHTFLWRGIDGTEVFSHFPPANTYNATLTPEELLRDVTTFKERDRCSRLAALFGAGDGGGGPSRRDLERARRAADHEDLPRVTQEFARDFFPKLAADAKDLPVWTGELHLDIHRGTLTSQAHNKRFNRLAETALRDLEYLHVLAGFAHLSSAEIERFWRVVLLNQFHDILPGSSIARVHAESREQYRQLMREVDRAADRLRTEMFERIDTSGKGQAVVVTNALSWERTENAFVASRRRNIRSAVAPDGTPVPVQASNRGGRPGYMFPARVPSMGHAVYHLSSERPSRGASSLKVTKRSLENALVKVAFAADGTIRRMVDKRAKRDVAAGPGNQLLLFDDHPHMADIDAWDLEVYHDERPPEQARLVKSRVTAKGPLEAGIEQTYELGRSRIVQNISLDAGSPLLRFRTWVDWRENRKLLKTRFHANVHADRASFEIQYGHLTRPTHRNTAWDLAQFEAVGHRWVDLSQPNCGVAILNDGKYGHSIQGNVMDMSLLRSPKAPDATADLGEHTFNYAIYPHAGDLVQGGVVRAAAAFNVPLRAFGTRAHAGPVSRVWSNFAVDGDCVNIACVKKAEDDRSVILRLYEIHGTDARVTVTFGRHVARAAEVNLMEEQERSLRIAGRRLNLSFKPFEIKTIKVILGRLA